MRIIAGEAGGRKILAPEGKGTRPTLDRVRENLFNMIQYKVPGSRVLDLFAGSGALSLEALSRGAEEAVLNDHDRKASLIEIRNIESLGYSDRSTVLTLRWQDAVRKLTADGRKFSLVFLDPPYAIHDLRDVFSCLVPLLSPDALVVLEHESRERPVVGDAFECVREKEWGYCAASLYRLKSFREEEEESRL